MQHPSCEDVRKNLDNHSTAAKLQTKTQNENTETARSRIHMKRENLTTVQTPLLMPAVQQLRQRRLRMDKIRARPQQRETNRLSHVQGAGVEAFEGLSGNIRT